MGCLLRAVVEQTTLFRTYTHVSAGPYHLYGTAVAVLGCGVQRAACGVRRAPPRASFLRGCTIQRRATRLPRNVSPNTYSSDCWYHHNTTAATTMPSHPPAPSTSFAKLPPPAARESPPPPPICADATPVTRPVSCVYVVGRATEFVSLVGLQLRRWQSSPRQPHQSGEPPGTVTCDATNVRQYSFRNSGHPRRQNRTRWIILSHAQSFSPPPGKEGPRPLSHARRRWPLRGEPRRRPCCRRGDGHANVGPGHTLGSAAVARRCPRWAATS